MKNIKRFGRKLWKRIFLRDVHYTDNRENLGNLYRLEDPWDLASEKEHSRFKATNRLITEHLGHVGSILEVGCGEGHQTEFLARISDRVLGIDVSERAVERARKRLPEIEFESGDIFDCPILEESPKFDLVTACEVLYYMKDVPRAMSQLNTLGRSVLVTYYENQAPILDPVLDAFPGSLRDLFSFDGTTWHARLWLAGETQKK